MAAVTFLQVLKLWRLHVLIVEDLGHLQVLLKPIHVLVHLHLEYSLLGIARPALFPTASRLAVVVGEAHTVVNYLWHNVAGGLAVRLQRLRLNTQAVELVNNLIISRATSKRWITTTLQIHLIVLLKINLVAGIAPIDIRFTFVQLNLIYLILIPYSIYFLHSWLLLLLPGRRNLRDSVELVLLRRIDLILRLNLWFWLLVINWRLLVNIIRFLDLNLVQLRNQDRLLFLIL